MGEKKHSSQTQGFLFSKKKELPDRENNYVLFVCLFLFLAASGLRCSAQASHCGGFSCCGARAVGAWASVVVARRL